MLATVLLTCCAAREKVIGSAPPILCSELVAAYSIDAVAYPDFFWVFVTRTFYYMGLSIQASPTPTPLALGPAVLLWRPLPWPSRAALGLGSTVTLTLTPTLTLALALTLPRPSCSSCSVTCRRWPTPSTSRRCSPWCAADGESMGRSHGQIAWADRRAG